MEKQLKKYIRSNILAMLGMSCYILVDTFFISATAGADGITALNIALPVYGIVYAIGSMIGVGSATRHTLCKASGHREEHHKSGNYFSNAVICTLSVSIPFIAAGIFEPAMVLRLFGADDEIVGVGLSYIRIVLCCTPFFMLNLTFTAFVRNDAAPNTAMTATLISGAFNIVFDYVFMFPLKMGIAGAALATGLAPVVSMLVCLRHFLSDKNTVRFAPCLPSWHMLVSSCALGTAAFVSEISSAVTTAVFNFILLNLAGNIAVAAYGVTANCALIGTEMFNGVSQGLQPLTSAAHGESNAETEKNIYRYSLKASVAIAIVLVGLVWLLADVIIAAFNSEGSAVLASYAHMGMRLYFLGFLFASVNVVRAGFYSAVDRAKESAVIAVSRGIAAIAAFAFLLSQMFGVTGVWLAFAASEVFTLLLDNFMRRISHKSK